MPRSLIKKYPRMRTLAARIHSKLHGTKVSISDSGNKVILTDAILNRCQLVVLGHDNYVTFGKGCKLWNTEIRITGNHCRITIGSKVRWRGLLIAEDDGSSLSIGTNTTAISATIVSSEGKTVSIGNNCMLSKNVDIRSSDGHSIIDKNSQHRTNPAEEIFIGNDVWIGAGASVLKGVTIGDGCVVGAKALVTRSLPNNTLSVGSPARVVRHEITWSRKRL